MQDKTDGMTFVFFGIVGSGKGTQVKLIQDFLKQKDGKECVYAGTGDGFRKIVASHTYAGSLLKETMDNGRLIADFFANSVVTNILVQAISSEKHLMADGYPRTLAQAKVFEEMMTFFRRQDVKIIHIELDEEEATRRNLLRGRTDDTKEGLANRFKEYEENVVPAINYFKTNPNYRVLAINGKQSVENVHQDIIRELGFSV
jgi:adenylate kinase